MTSSTQAIRIFDAATGRTDGAGRVRALRVRTRHLLEDQQFWPENPSGGGRAASPIALRHVVSFILGLAGYEPSAAPDAVEMLQYLSVTTAEHDERFAFLTPSTLGISLRSYLETVVQTLAELDPASFEAVTDALSACDWHIYISRSFSVFRWERRSPPAVTAGQAFRLDYYIKFGLSEGFQPIPWKGRTGVHYEVNIYSNVVAAAAAIVREARLPPSS